MTLEAIKHLRRVDPVMKGIIRQVGECQLKPNKSRTPFETLVRAVAHQQLHGRAAESILARFRSLYPGKRFPKPEDLVRTDFEKLRGVGFSNAKVTSILDIAAKTIEGVVPSGRHISRMDNESIIAQITQVRGVGRWTVEMMLIFKLGRPDVLPIDDFGIREGFRLAYKLESLPKPSEFRAFGELWQPYRTTASWYLWRAADLLKAPSKP